MYNLEVGGQAITFCALLPQKFDHPLAGARTLAPLDGLPARSVRGWYPRKEFAPAGG